MDAAATLAYHIAGTIGEIQIMSIAKMFEANVEHGKRHYQWTNDTVYSGHGENHYGPCIVYAKRKFDQN